MSDGLCERPKGHGAGKPNGHPDRLHWDDDGVWTDTGKDVVRRARLDKLNAEARSR